MSFLVMGMHKIEVTEGGPIKLTIMVQSED